MATLRLAIQGRSHRCVHGIPSFLQSRKRNIVPTPLYPGHMVSQPELAQLDNRSSEALEPTAVLWLESQVVV
jgi:hypothetical protein